VKLTVTQLVKKCFLSYRIQKFVAIQEATAGSCAEPDQLVHTFKPYFLRCLRPNNEELHNVYSSPSIIRVIKSRRMRWTGHAARMGERRNAYRILVGKPDGKRPLGRPRRRWVDNVKVDLREVGWDGGD
jgi:hypothetical protein